MQKTGIIKYALIVFLLLSSIAFAETQKMKEHKVVKGDTLWDITETELADPFRWPEVWKVNPWIKNPHWIYPKQIIKIPLYLLKKEKLAEETAKYAATSPVPAQEELVAPEPTVEVTKEVVRIVKHPLVNKSVLMAGGYIADTIPGVGRMSDSASGEFVFGNGDIVYVALDHPARIGDKFYVIKASDRIKHPVTGEKIGYVITISGIAEIVKIKDGETMVKITKCFGEINKGDPLVLYYDIDTPLTTGNFRSPNIKGTIIANGNNMKMQTALDIIYIDKGCKDGIEAGDMFRTIVVDIHATPNGLIQVIDCRDHTATAIIKYSSAPVSRGNIFTKVDNN